jgi:hypothetical protein
MLYSTKLLPHGFVSLGREDSPSNGKCRAFRRFDVTLAGAVRFRNPDFTRMQMAIRNNSLSSKFVLGFGLLLPIAGAATVMVAQAPAAPAAAAAASERGTVKTVSGSTITMATDAGQTTTVNVATGAKVLQVPVGSTDLKSATTIQLTDIAAGDHILVTGKAGDTPDTFNAVRVIQMKSADIAQQQAADQAEWRANGVGGIVSAVDPATGTITLTSGAKKITVATSSKTAFKRFAADSVKYQDAKPGTLADIHATDQLQAKGTKSADGLSIQADEVVSGAFENLSGLIATIDPAMGTITLRDLATKKTVTVDVTKNADIRKLSPMVANMFAQRSQGGAAGAGGGRRGGGAGAGAAGGDAASMRRSAGADLSQMISRQPAITLADLNKGDALMIVASAPTPGATTVTAVTVLAGVEPILTANPNGGMDLSMSLGGGGGGSE